MRLLAGILAVALLGLLSTLIPLPLGDLEFEETAMQPAVGTADSVEIHYFFKQVGDDGVVENSAQQDYTARITGAIWDVDTGSLLLDGDADYLTVEGSSQLSFPGAFTIGISFLVQAIPSGHMALITKRGTTSDASIGMWLYRDRVYVSIHNHRREDSLVLISSQSLSAGVYHTVEVRRDTLGAVTLWIDGMCDLSRGRLAGTIDPPGEVFVGRHVIDSGQDFYGRMRRVVVSSWGSEERGELPVTGTLDAVLQTSPRVDLKSSGDVEVSLEAPLEAVYSIEYALAAAFDSGLAISVGKTESRILHRQENAVSAILNDLEMNASYVYRLLAETDSAVKLGPRRVLTTAQGFLIGREEPRNLDVGCLPECGSNIVSFDSQGRPYIRDRDHTRDYTSCIWTMRNGEWKRCSFIDEVRVKYPTFSRTLYGGGWRGARIVFDDDDVLYTLVTIELLDGTMETLMVWSMDYGQSYEVVTLPRGDFHTLEFGAGWNELEGPPFLCILKHVEEHPSRWTSRYELYVTKPTLIDGELEVGSPVLVTVNCMGISLHSGGSSLAASREGKSHFIWVEIGDDVQGSEVYVATYDHATSSVVGRSEVCQSFPANDMHCSPGICMDEVGVLHVVSGGHCSQFYYSHSLLANDATGGWSDPVGIPLAQVQGTDVETSSGGTYISLVCDDRNTLHLVFRETRTGLEQYWPGETHNALCYTSKPFDGAWRMPRILVVPPIPGYSIYYQKLALRQDGALFLSMSFLSGFELDLAHKIRQGIYHDKTLLVSHDHGLHWREVERDDFSAAAEGRA